MLRKLINFLFGQPAIWYDVTNIEELRFRVKKRAEEYWKQDGYPEGNDLNIWLEAEKDILFENCEIIYD